MKKLTWVIWGITVSVIGMILFIFISNRAYFSEKREVVNIENMSFVNWQTDGNKYTSMQDSQIKIYQVDKTVRSIYINAEHIKQNLLTPQIYYTERKGEEFTEEKSFSQDIIVTDSVVEIRLDKTIYDLRIDLTELSGLQFEVGNEFIQYTLNFQINIIEVICIGFILFSLCVLVLNFKQIIQSLNDFKKHNFLLSYLVARDFKVKYRRSTLGVLWSVLNPLLMMIVVSAVFSFVFRSNIPQFQVYLILGQVCFNFLSEATNVSMTSILGSASLIKKAKMPKIIFPLEKVVFSFINFLISFIAVIIVFIWFRVEIKVSMLMLPVLLVCLFFFVLGISFFLASATVFFRDILHLYAVFLTAWSYLTPIFYPIDSLSPKMIQLMSLNPMYHYISYFREIVINGTIPSLTKNIICVGFSLIVFIIGFLVFKSNEDKFILRI